MRARLTILALLVASCADDSLSPMDRRPQPLTVWNSTQRPLEEVRVHDDTEYLEAANELLAPLEDDDRTVVDIISSQHVTVIRRNVDGGQRIAFTTATGLYVPTPGYVLQVFQESFRLHEPDFQDGAPPDGGDFDRDGGDFNGDTGGDP
jgi:hypothetical protein